MFRTTQDTTKLHDQFKYGTITLYGDSFQSLLLLTFLLYRSPTTPKLPQQLWFGLIRVRSPLLTESFIYFLLLWVLRCFSSPRSLHLHGDRSSTYRVAPFGHLGIKGYLRLTQAFRSLSRPSSPPRAKASTVCP